KTESRHDRNAMFRAGHHQVPALRHALSCWWRQIGDTVCRCTYESALQVKGKLIPAENRGIIGHSAAAQTLCRQAAANARRGAGGWRPIAEACGSCWGGGERQNLLPG